MALKVAIQMDPIDAIDIDGDSSFRIAEEAQARGHALLYYTPDMLSYREGRVLATQSLSRESWDCDFEAALRQWRGGRFQAGGE